MTPPNLTLLCQEAVALHRQGDLVEAERLYARVLAAEPGNFLANHSLGVIRFRQKRNPEALTLFGAALKADPNAIPALANYGLALQEEGRAEEALANFDKALALAPAMAELSYLRGIALWDLKRYDEALASYDRALAAQPDHAKAWYNRGNTLLNLKRPAEALASFDKALALVPDFAEALNNRGNALNQLNRLGEALASYDRGLLLRPGYASALCNRGNVLRRMNRLDEALASFNEALARAPGHIAALNNRGNTLFDMKRTNEALADYEAALTLQPDNAGALVNRADVLRISGRLDEAAANFERALEIEPGNALAYSGLAYTALYLCDWRRTQKIGREIAGRIIQDRFPIGPLVLLGYCDDPALELECARIWLSDRIPVVPEPLWRGAPQRKDKIRVAYLSADFYKHATAVLMAELFERHDRARFEIVAISFGPDDASPMRARLVKAFDAFHDVRTQSDLEVARLLKNLNVDIAVDLKGFTTDARPDILSHRPCPVQVSYIGYPGTMGAPFIDYIIADPVVLPQAQQAFYDEKIVQLPDCYQVNDSTRVIAAQTPSRTEAGLPETGFVFCCFNSHWKITPQMFDIWMRLLAEVPGSLLWLIDENRESSANLRAEAAARGIAPERLIFAPKREHDAHLARHRLADLFLDTLPYNAHTTASDALWAGLPLITCLGTGFAARVGASLLTAVGLPELVTPTLKDYESLALRLAQDDELRRNVRHKLAQNRLTAPLFDTDRFRLHLEAAYVQMLDIAVAGEAPRFIRVEA